MGDCEGSRTCNPIVLQVTLHDDCVTDRGASLSRSQAYTAERKAPQIDGMLVFDCDTRIDKTQALTFGSYRFLVASTGIEKRFAAKAGIKPRARD